MDWTDADHAILRKLWQPGAWNNELLEALPGRSKLVIQRRAHDLGLTRPMESSARAWGADEDALLRDNYPQEGAGVVHRLPGRTRKATKARAAALGIRYLR